jgi:hypothetical protein
VLEDVGIPLLQKFVTSGVPVERAGVHSHGIGLVQGLAESTGKRVVVGSNPRAGCAL